MKKKTILVRNVSDKVLKVSDRLSRYMGMSQAQAFRLMLELGAKQLLDKTRKLGPIVVLAFALSACGKLPGDTLIIPQTPQPQASEKPVIGVMGCYYTEQVTGPPKIFESYSVVEYTDGTTSSQCAVFAQPGDNSQENSTGSGDLDCVTSSVVTGVNGQWTPRGTLLVRHFSRTGQNTGTMEGSVMSCVYNLATHY